jgi:Domain of unknown function (DUF6916)
MVELTEQEFSKHLNTNFRVNVEAPKPIELELVEVQGYTSAENEQPGMERFSVFFSGPKDIQLLQCSYPLTHESMGSFDLFLVPIGLEDKGIRYEAVFNYFKDR